MDQQSRMKVGSMIVALALLGMVGLSLAPSAQAEGSPVTEQAGSGSCITVYQDPVDVTVSPRDCTSAETDAGMTPGGTP